MAAGEPFGIRRIGARVTMINHLEASYPTIATDYILAIFDAELADYLAEFTDKPFAPVGATKTALAA